MKWLKISFLTAMLVVSGISLLRIVHHIVNHDAKDIDEKAPVISRPRFAFFDVVENENGYRIMEAIEDTQTGCLYLVRLYGNSAAMTPVLNPDGSPWCDQEGSQ